MTPELHRSLMIGYSLFIGAIILSPMGLVIILLITAFYYLLGRIGSKTMIWISAFILTTISNSYANLYMDFVSDQISRHQKYFIEFSGMISIGTYISF